MRMKVDESSVEGHVAIQPETRIEQDLVSELFIRLEAISQASPHPDYHGTRTVYFSTDLSDFENLDLSAWADSHVRVNEHGRLDPEPGSRALVVAHTPNALEGNGGQGVGDAGDETEDETVGKEITETLDEEFEEVADSPESESEDEDEDDEYLHFDVDDDATAPDDVEDLEPVDDEQHGADQEEVEEAIEEELDDDIESETRAEIVKGIESVIVSENTAYEDLQDAAKEAQSLGYDVPANNAAAVIRDDLERVVELETVGVAQD